MTRRARGLAFVIAALAAVAAAAAARLPQPTVPAADNPFPVGERLVYEVRFGLLRLGSAEMRVVGIDTIRGQPAAHIRFEMKGGNFYYRLHNTMDSWIALADTSSLRFIQDFDEGGKKRFTHYEIFPDSGYYRQQGIDSLFPATPKPLDDAAFFYFARTVPLEVGKRHEFQRYFRPDRNPVILEVLARDTVDLPSGKYPSLLIQPIIKGGGILAEASEARMWLTDDHRRLMVQLKTRLSFATITLRLSRIEHDSSTTDTGSR